MCRKANRNLSTSDDRNYEMNARNEKIQTFGKEKSIFIYVKM